MTGEDKHTDFERRVKAMLDQGTEDLDAHVMSRLNRAHHAALETLEVGRPGYVRWVPAAAVATATFLAVLLWTGEERPTEFPETLATVLEDLELFSDEEELEFYEDLEFYAWLDESGDLG